MESKGSFASSRATRVKSLLCISFKCLSAVVVTATLLFSSVMSAYSGQAMLSWDAVSDPSIVGYTLHYGTESGSYTQSVDTGNATSYTVNNLTAGQMYYFATVAYNSAGSQSGFSNEVSETVSSAVPSSLTITATAGANGTISPSGSVNVNSGSSQTYTITPNSNYYIVSVSVDGVVVARDLMTYSYAFSNVTSNHTISATFAYCTKLITVSSGTGGSISPTSTYVNVGSSETFTITPNSGYKVSDVKVDGASVGAVTSYTFSNVTTPHTISATFVLTTASSYTIAASATTGGSISPEGTVTVSGGSSKSYNISPKTNRYRISDVKVDGISKGAISFYNFSNVSANHTIQAQFTRK